VPLAIAVCGELLEGREDLLVAMEATGYGTCNSGARSSFSGAIGGRLLLA
jgi:hypothetical protein